MIVIAVVIAIASGLWTAWRYKAIGAVGMSGVAVAASPILIGDADWWHWLTLVASMTLFVIGQLVSKAIDDWFHWGALLVNVLPWTVWLVTWIVSWPIWAHMTTTPTILVVLSGIALIYGTYRFIRWFYHKIKAWWRSRPEPVPADPAQPTATQSVQN